MLEIFVRWFVLAAIALGIVIWLTARKDAAHNAKTELDALENIDELCDEFFDGSKTKIWKAADLRLPADLTIAEAAERGYTIASKDGKGMSATIVFVRN